MFLNNGLESRLCSIPGYSFSEPPTETGFGAKETADVFDKVMKRLGYGHYIAQGGDW